MAAAPAAVGVLLAGCTTNTDQSPVEEGVQPQNFLEPVGRLAQDVDRLWDVVLWVAIGIFVLVQGLLLVAVLRFRERPGQQDELPLQVHGNPRLEAAWTIIPALILAAVAIPTVGSIFSLAQEPAEAMTVTVTGHQWWWEFEYPGITGPDGQPLITANELHIPTGETVVLEVTSADVVHSFWVPKITPGKQDAVPGRTSPLKIQTDTPGEYLGQCTEYCGLSHANMRARVIAQPPDEFRSWATAHAKPQSTPPEPGTLAAQGRQEFFSGACVGCHTIRGTEAAGKVGPDLTYFADRGWFASATFKNDVTGKATNVRRWLADPPAMKPMAPGSINGMPNLGLSDQEIDALVAYLATLSTGAEADGDAGPRPAGGQAPASTLPDNQDQQATTQQQDTTRQAGGS